MDVAILKNTVLTAGDSLVLIVLPFDSSVQVILLLITILDCEPDAIVLAQLSLIVALASMQVSV